MRQQTALGIFPSATANLNYQNQKKPFFIAMVLAVLMVFSSVSSQAYAQDNQLIEVKKQPPVWQAVINKLPALSGVFNKDLRIAVREQLNLPKMSDIQAADPEWLNVNLLPRLQQLDTELKQYIRVSEKKDRYQQLKQLMPALANIEERRIITELLTQQGVRIMPLRNERLLRIIDKRIEQLADSMIFNMKALVRERRPYEPDLLKAMAAYGVMFSARPPDFILQYELIPEGLNAEGEWVYQTQIALLNKLQFPVVSLNETVISEAQDEQQAEQKTVWVMAKLVTMHLKEYLVSHAFDHNNS